MINYVSSKYIHSKSYINAFDSEAEVKNECTLVEKMPICRAFYYTYAKGTQSYKKISATLSTNTVLVSSSENYIWDY